MKHTMSSARWLRALHRAGIEVILDVVFNHTAEGDHRGPCYSYKGIDNSTYYILSGNPRPSLYELFGHRQHAALRQSVCQPHDISTACDTGSPWIMSMVFGLIWLPSLPASPTGV